jgi:MFS family permease
MAIHAGINPSDDSAALRVSRPYAWLVFALTFGLLISDYMSRQVLNAVFPLLKVEWLLSDTQLGSLSSIVALLVGTLTFPLSVVADRWGRVKSIVLMAALWSLATAACALAASFDQMFWARFFVGVGEAAYGSVGVALVVSLFPQHLRATIVGAFMAGGAFGSVLGMALGGLIAAQLGWRWAFGAMAGFGFLLVILYFMTVSDRKTGGTHAERGALPAFDLKKLLRDLFSSRSIICAYMGSGLQLFVLASFMAWLPSFLNRYYALETGRAGVVAAVFVLIGAVGMIVCGNLTDRLSRRDPERKWFVAIGYCVVTLVLVGIALSLPVGTPQLVVLGLGLFLSAGTTGPAGAIVTNLTPSPIHATAFATLTLFNNFLGLAAGPYITGIIADQQDLLAALRVAGIVPVLAIAAFLFGRLSYRKDIQAYQVRHAATSAPSAA